MKVKIYHAKYPNFGYEAIRASGVFPKDFVHVADVEVKTKDIIEGLEEAYRLTNTIEVIWNLAHKSNVKCFIDRPRSTSVGDVLEVQGKQYYCHFACWKTIEDSPVWVEKKL